MFLRKTTFWFVLVRRPPAVEGNVVANPMVMQIDFNLFIFTILKNWLQR